MARAPGTVKVCEAWVASARTADSRPAGTTDKLLLETPNWSSMATVASGRSTWQTDGRNGSRSPGPGTKQRPPPGAARRTGTSTPDPR